MKELKDQALEPCRKDTPRLSVEEQNRLLSDLPRWEIVEADGQRQLKRVFKLKNFAEALALTTRIGALAEAESHHPAILVEYGRVSVRWWTHLIGGLHKNDFIMAARTDALHPS